MSIEPTATAFIFPGQGSQRLGMGKALAEKEPQAAEVFSRADAVLGFSLSRLCWEGPEEQLNETEFTQPALLTHSIAALRVLQAKIPDLVPAFVAGHSMGEFSALVAAGVLSFEDGLRLVGERGAAMKEAGMRAPGGMLAVIGLEIPAVSAAIQRAAESSGQVVVLANDNCPGQCVISGDDQGLQAAEPLLQAAGARKLVRLAVSIAAHSPLMAEAQARFDRSLAEVDFQPPAIAVVGNVAAERLSNTQAIRAALSAQLTSSVRWTESIQWMIANGVDTFVEIGSGSVLSGLLRRIDRRAASFNVDSPESIDLLLQSG